MTNGLKMEAGADREVVVTRVIGAPRPIVFDAFTKPEIIKRWMLGPDGWTMPVCEMDLRAGGAYRWVWQKGENGTQMSVTGAFREVAAPERLVNTEAFEGIPDPDANAALNTVTFTEKDGRTYLELLVECNDRESRDAIINSGMESGMQESYDALEQVAVTLQA